MKRHYEKLIQEYFDYFPCVVLVGARQTGKSTLINMVSDTREIFDLESRADYDAIANDPDLFLRSNDKPIAIDEAQLLPDLFPALRVAIDKDRQANGKYLLSGSSSPELLTVISESLAGRVGVIEIAPFSFSETTQTQSPLCSLLLSGQIEPDELKGMKPQNNINDINEYWFNGGYPEPWLRNKGKFREAWREQYIKTFVERDIARLFPNLNTVRFRRFIELLAGCTGTIINYSNIARILDVSQPTIKDYFRIAHGTFLWRNLPAYTKNTTKRVSKHPKGYLRDTGLLHHLLQIPSHKKLLSHPQMGNSWEAMVIEEILRNLNAFGIDYSCYYYRTSGGAEIDLVLESKFGLIPIEVKHTQNVNLKSLKSIRDFVKDFGCAFGIVINNDEKVRIYDDKVWGIPFSILTKEY